MSAPTSGSADGNSIPGYYPDPSIPDYIRYWDGAAWVPGTSRPAPAEGEALPAPPPGVAVAQPPVVHPEPEPSSVRTQITAAVPDETGPMFLDEPPAADDPEAAVPGPRPGGDAETTDDARPAADRDDPRRAHGSRPEPATAWHADAARQSGLAGRQDHRVSWGSGTGPTAPVPDPRGGDRPAAGPSGDREPDGTAPAAGDRDATGTDPGRADRSTPGDRTPPGTAVGPEPAGTGTPRPGTPTQQGDGTLTLRAVRPGSPAGPGATSRDQGTLTIRAVGGEARRAQEAGAATGPGPAPAGPATPAAPTASATPAAPAAPGGGAVPAQGGPAAAPPQGWAQQVHQLAQQPGDRPAAGVPATPGRTAATGADAPPPDGVIPWKPPVDNPFLQAAQAQGRPATLGRRLAARLIDSVLLLAVVGAAAIPLWTKAKDHIDAKIDEAKLTGETVTVYLLDGTTGTYLGIVLGVLLVAGLLYEALPTAKWGRTLGKKLCGLRTLDIESHATPTFGSALRRWLVYGVLGVLVIGVVNVVWCLFDRPWRQCWHDKAARTFVATNAS